jgi:hypothetical protein
MVQDLQKHKMIANSAAQAFGTRRESLILLIFLLSDNHVPTIMELNYALRGEIEMVIILLENR